MTASIFNGASTGDVLFTRGSDLLSRSVCWLTGPASHQETFWDAQTLVSTESNFRVGKVGAEQEAEEIARTRREWIVFHWVKPMPPVTRTLLQVDLDEACLWETYSMPEIVLQAMDAIWNNLILGRPKQGLDAYVFRRLGRLWKNGIICSGSSNRALIRNGLIPRESGLQYGSPSDTYRWLLKSERAAILARSPGWFGHVRTIAPLARRWK